MRNLPALAAVAVVGAVVVAGVAGGLGSGSGDASPETTVVTTSVAPPVASTPPTQAVVTEPAVAPVVTTDLSQTLSYGMAGADVEALQTRLKELGFEPGPVDGQYGSLTRMAVWAYKKLVLQIPRDEVDATVTNEMWQFMQGPIRVEPRRRWSDGEATRNHTEVYLPEQVVVFFIDDEPVLISHMASGTGQEWKEVVTIDVGEYGNVDGPEPIERGEIGVSITPGGVFTYDRFVEGIRESALGSMYDPAYFNYGIAIHGAMNVPLEPASHGCVRMPQTIGRIFHQFVAKGDQVFVWDGVHEPEFYGPQLPTFNRIDPEWAASTTTTTALPATTQPQPTTPAPTTPAATQPRPTQPAATSPPTPTTPPTPAPTAAPTTVPPVVTDPPTPADTTTP